MTDPFTLVNDIAVALGMTPIMVSLTLAVVAAIIGFSITSLMAGKPMLAFRILATGFALIMFFIFSKITGAVSGI